MVRKNIICYIILIFNFINIEAAISAIYVIGYKDNIPILSDFESSNLYCFDGDFSFYKKGPMNYIPFFINDSVEIYYSKENAKEIKIIKKNKVNKYNLPDEPLMLISNLEGDTLFYTVGNSHVEKLKLFIINSSKIINGIEVDNESFWYRNSKIIYSETYNSETKIYISTPNGEKKRLINTPNHPYQFLTVSNNGKFLHARMANPDNQSEFLSIIINIDCNKYVIEKIKDDKRRTPIFYDNNLYLYNLNNPEEFYKSDINLDSICE